jgi:uncharacterized protein (DUF2384 family)
MMVSSADESERESSARTPDRSLQGAVGPRVPEGREGHVAPASGEEQDDGYAEGWLLDAAELLAAAAESPNAGEYRTAVEGAIQRSIEDAAAALDFDTVGATDASLQDQARTLIRHLMAFLPASQLTATSIASTGDGWLTAVWLVTLGKNTTRLSVDDWAQVESITPLVQRERSEGLIQWLRRRDEFAARCIETQHQRVTDPQLLRKQTELREMLVAVFGSQSAAGRWMRSRIPALGGRTPASLILEDGETGFDGVIRVLNAIQTGTYL